MSQIAALILAAGASSRFGGCKLLVDLNGRSLLQRRIDLAAELLPNHVYVVSGAWHAELLIAQQSGDLSGARLLYNQRWADGLSTSLATGIEMLEKDYAAVLVLLADQVKLVGSDLEKLLAAFDGANISCGLYNGKRGVPAVFAANSFARLKALRGDQGAKGVLYQSSVPVHPCAMPNAACDIDTFNQLVAWQKAQNEAGALII